MTLKCDMALERIAWEREQAEKEKRQEVTMTNQRTEKTTWTREEAQQAIDEGWTVHTRGGHSLTLTAGMKLRDRCYCLCITGPSNNDCLAFFDYEGSSALDVTAYTKPPVEYVTREDGHPAVVHWDADPSSALPHVATITGKDGSYASSTCTWLTNDLRYCEHDEEPYLIPRTEYAAMHSWTPGNPGTPEQKRAWAEKHKGEKWSCNPGDFYFVPDGTVEDTGDRWVMVGTEYGVEGYSAQDVWSMDSLDWQPHSGNFDDYREKTPWHEPMQVEIRRRNNERWGVA